MDVTHIPEVTAVDFPNPKMDLNETFSSPDGKEVFTIVSAQLVPLYQRIRRTNSIDPAPGMIFACEKGGKPKNPLQVAVFAGGQNIDIVQGNGELKRIASYGYDSVRKTNQATYDKPGTPEIADFIFGVAAKVLDSEVGREFRASLKSPEAIVAAEQRRNVKKGFSAILAVQGDHYATSRNSTTPEEYALLSDERKLLRERGESPSGARSVSENDLPF